MTVLDDSIFILCFGALFGLMIGLPLGSWIESRAIAKVWGDDWESRIADET